jgi:hypothetical protein
MFSVDAEAIMAQVTSNPRCLCFLNFFGLPQIVWEVWWSAPRNDLPCCRHGDNIRRISLGEVVSQQVLVFEIDNNARILCESAHVVTAGAFLNFDSTDFLNQVSKYRSQLLLLLPGKSVIPRHLTGTPQIFFRLFGRTFSLLHDDLI